MAVETLNVEKPKFGIDVFLPQLITFGPLLLLMGLQFGIDRASRSFHWLEFVTAVIGMSMLVTGLAALKSRQDSLGRRLEELERLNN